jgi:hypothetical protein
MNSATLARFKEVTAGIVLTEGSIGDEEAEYLGSLVWDLGTICIAQTGLGMGKSAWAFLSANPYCTVVTFDNAAHAQAGRLEQIVSDEFPGRHHVVWGDSKQTLPRALALPKPWPVDLECPLVFIDGGHDFETCYSDLKAFHKAGRIVVLDDCYLNGTWNPPTGVLNAWTRAFTEGLVKPISYHEEVQPSENRSDLPWAWVKGVYV